MRQPGEWIHGKYQVQRVLGAGGMGTVYATKRRNESTAAVKVLHPQFAHDKTIRARFLEEGYLANRVGHPAVVTIVEDDIDEAGNFYIVMELLDGADLSVFVGPPRIPLTTAQTLNVADQLLTALGQAHQKGIVHLDIKPANVMILRDGRVMLLDFGIARALSGSPLGSAFVDDDEEVLGTDRYMSPEQGHGSFEEIDARSDLWSLGALMMALLAGQDAEAVPLWDQSYEDRAWSFSRLGQDVPPHVVQIISLALQPQKNKRWVSAAAMREAVRSAHLGLYGAITRESLALLVQPQLVESAEGVVSRAPEQEAIPVALDPTVASRPSHAPPLASERRSSPSLAEHSLSEFEVGGVDSARYNTPIHESSQIAADSAPQTDSTFQIESSTQSSRRPQREPRPRLGLRNLGFGLLLVVLGGGLVLALASRVEPSMPAQESVQMDKTATFPDAPESPASELPASQFPQNVRPAPEPKLLDEAGSISQGTAPNTLNASTATVPADTTETGVDKPKVSKKRPKTSKPSSRVIMTDKIAPPATPSPPPPDVARNSRCNGLDGLFNVEHCESP